MNAYFEPLYPSLATGVASPDKNFGLWLHSSGLLQGYVLPVMSVAAVAGIAYLVRRKSKGQPLLRDAAGKSVAAAALASAVVSVGILGTGSGAVRMSDKAVMPVWPNPSPSQVLQALTQCEFWVSPVQGEGRYTCPQRYGQAWENFTESSRVRADDSSGPVAAPVMRSVTTAQMAALTQTAKRLSAKFAEDGCYMPAHPAAHVWCAGRKETATLADWAMSQDGQAWSHRACSYGKAYVYTARQYLEPKIEQALGSPALVRYVMPVAVSCGGQSVGVAQLGDWLTATVARGIHKETPGAEPSKSVDVALLR